MQPRRALKQALDFILSEATEPELDVLEGAIKRRQGGKPSQDPREMDFRAMAASMTGDLTARFATPGGDQIREMTRNMVANIIRTHEPNMPAEHLEELLDRYVPDPSRERPGPEAHLPIEAVVMMVRQFVAYGEGRMPASEEAELKREMPDWSKRYWEMFGSVTQKLIARRLKGELDAKQFDEALSRHLAERSRPSAG